MGRPLWEFSSFLALAALAASQTFTNCNPTLVTCPSDLGLAAPVYDVDFRQGGDATHWSSVGTGAVTYTPLGAAFTIAEQGNSPTMETAWYFFFGRAEVHMRAAPGTGIVSCVVLESDDLDEVDWEWLGGDAGEVQTNYFGKGNTTTYDRGGTAGVADAQGALHNYTIDWTPAAITWYVDGGAVRTLAYDDAVGGLNFPQTPMRLKLGVWAGGDARNANGTIAWAGGLTNYSAGPFTMYVERVTVANANPAASYAYGDRSGDWTSIIAMQDDDGDRLFSADYHDDDGDDDDGGASKSIPAAADRKLFDVSMNTSSSDVDSGAFKADAPAGSRSTAPPDLSSAAARIGYAAAQRVWGLRGVDLAMVGVVLYAVLC